MSLRRNSVRARWTAPPKCRIPALLAMASGMFVATRVQAASLQEVTSGWASGVPSYVSMYVYVPDKLATPPPIMVASHYCGGSAPAYFGFTSNIVSLANELGFIMIFPQTSNNCWDVGSTQSLTRNGGGDTQAIAEMVQYAITTYSADSGRVYAMGSSSGAMMTEALMGLYPDVFKAGAEMSGVPDGCWAVDDPSGGWSGPCAGGMVSMTAMEWGDLVRAQYPGYAGPRPRLWLWVGTADPIISPNNFGESILEWTNVLGLSATPTSTETPDAGYTGQLWNNSCDRTVLEGWTLDGGGHAPVPSPQNANAIVTFFGLDTSGPDLGAGCADAGGSSDAGTGGGDASMMGADASRGGGGDASIPGSDGGVHDSDAGARRIDAGAVDSDGGGASHGDSGGCGCRVGPTEGRSLAALAAPIGAILGIVLRRRRRLRGRERQFR